MIINDKRLEYLGGGGGSFLLSSHWTAQQVHKTLFDIDTRNNKQMIL